jgi:DNA-binding FadR family transcriptional regulator
MGPLTTSGVEIQRIVEWLNEQRRVTLRRLGIDELACASHRQIYEAIRDKDPDLARRSMRAHLEEISQKYWRIRDGRYQGVMTC